MKPQAKKQATSSNNSLPLQNFSFYLDMNNKSVEERIASLGGKIETFLSKHVDYFITEESKLTASSVRKSPRLTQTKGSSRAKLMLDKAKKETKAQTTTLDRAKKLGVTIQSLNNLKKWLSDVEKVYPTKKAVRSTSPKNAATKLKGDFIKVECNSGNFQPLWKEFDAFPKVQFNSTIYESPFGDKKHETKPPVQPRSSALSTSSQGKRNSFKQQIKNSDSKTGYCELCDTNFNHRGQHLKSKQHNSNITPDNFAQLDQMIASGKSFQAFVAELNKKATKSNTKRKLFPVASKAKRIEELTKNLTVSPIRITFSARSGYSVENKVKSEESTTGSSNASMEVNSKRMKMNDYSCVRVDNLTIKIRRVVRRPGKFGSKLINYPMFQNDNSKSKRRVTRSSTLTYSKDLGKLRRSRRMIAKASGCQNFKCPVLIKSNDQ